MATTLGVSSSASNDLTETDDSRNQITGWTGMIRVDGDNYIWMGAADIGSTTVNQTSYTYTSTKSIFTMDIAGKVSMNITFTSPVYPDDMKRQSLTFSYMNVEVESSDGDSHDVQLYTDMTAGESFDTPVFRMPLTCDQNGYLASKMLLHNGIMTPLATSATTKSGDKSSWNSPRTCQTAGRV